MFATAPTDTAIDHIDFADIWNRECPTYANLAEAETALVALESEIAERRARQVAILTWLDAVRATRIQGTRTLAEWTASRLDVDRSTARDLVTAVRTSGRTSGDAIREMVDGDISFARAVATLRLVDAGADADQVTSSQDLDLPAVRRMTAAIRKVTPVDEKKLMEQRHLRISPTLGDTACHITALAPGHDGHLIEQALDHRLDQLPNPECGETRDQRRLDALSALARDYLDGVGATDDATAGVRRLGRGERSPGGVPRVTVFYDLESTGVDTGASGAVIAAGPRIGPATLERILCEGTVSIVGMKGQRPVTTTGTSRMIPPAVRDAVLRRDGGCVADGCTSRHRLQVHHVIERRNGGTNDPDNLATLCWYHHHVVIHGYGKRFDPTSPPRRRRFLSPGQPDPPGHSESAAPP